VKNPKNLTIRGSLWSLAHPSRGDHESCIIYLHPNSGCRADVVKTRVMTIAAHSKCAVCGFDFIGCGESDGNHVRAPSVSVSLPLLCSALSVCLS
jgi:alpha/beta superfamily hydrolase